MTRSTMRRRSPLRSLPINRSQGPRMILVQEPRETQMVEAVMALRSVKTYITLASRGKEDWMRLLSPLKARRRPMVNYLSSRMAEMVSGVETAERGGPAEVASREDRASRKRSALRAVLPVGTAEEVCKEIREAPAAMAGTVGTSASFLRGQAKHLE